MRKMQATDQANKPGNIPEPWEANPFSAKEAIRRGDAGPVADYLADASKLLVLLSEWLEAHEEQFADRSGDGSSVLPDGAAEEDWEASFEQVRQAIKLGDVSSVASFMRELGSVLQLLQGPLDNEASAAGWLLKFKRRRGRALDPFQKFKKRREIRRALNEAKSALIDPSRPNRRIKKEHLVEWVARKTGLSESHVYRLLRSSESPPKRS